MIYSMIARERTLLIEYTQRQGNFPMVAREVLKTLDLSKMFAQFCTSNYNFYIFNKENIVFMVMVENSYQMRIAVSFLKGVQERFFTMFDGDTRNSAVADALTGFISILSQSMAKYNNKEEVDKLTKLKKELQELETATQSNIVIVKIRKMGQDLIMRIQNLQAKLLQNTLKEQQALLSQMRQQKIDRNYLGQSRRMNQIIINSQKKLVYDEVVRCLKTIITESSTIVKDPLHISNKGFLAIWSLIYSYNPLQLEQYLNLKQFIPQSLLKSQIKKIHPLIQKYILKDEVLKIERNRYILQLLQRTDISFDHINEGEHNFSFYIPPAAEISPTSNMFPNKHKQLKEENKENP